MILKAWTIGYLKARGLWPQRRGSFASQRYTSGRRRRK